MAKLTSSQLQRLDEHKYKARGTTMLDPVLQVSMCYNMSRVTCHTDLLEMAGHVHAIMVGPQLDNIHWVTSQLNCYHVYNLL